MKNKIILLVVVAMMALLGAPAAKAATTTTTTFTTAGSSTWTAPAGVYWITIETWGGGGGGGGDSDQNGNGAGGGGGGAYARLNSYAVTPGNSYSYTVGAAGSAGSSAAGTGGNGGNTFFVNTSTLNAVGGTGGTGGNSGAGGAGGTAAASTGDVKFNGGTGWTSATTDTGGGGGGSGGTGSAGTTATGATGASAVTGGGPGANGNLGATGSTPASGPGGGGGGGGANSGTARAGGAGFAGQIRITYVTPTVETFTAAGSATWTAPAGVYQVTVETWGGGGGGGGDSSSSGNGAGGGGGGAYARLNTYPVTPGNSYSYTVGAAGTAGSTGGTSGGNGGNSLFVDTSTLNAVGGTGGTGGDGGAGGAGGAVGATGDAKFSGGSGRTSSVSDTGGGGGGSGGTASAGSTATSATGATAVTGGGPGGNGGNNANGGAPASGPGGGGGGGGNTGTARAGGVGFAGQIRITYTAPAVDTFTAAGNGTLIIPPNVTAITIETWGGGGGGGQDASSTANGGGGGGGGAYARVNSFAVTPGTSYSYTVGAGGASATAGSATTFNTTTAVAAGGSAGVAGNTGTGGAGGTAGASTGDVKNAGGSGFSSASAIGGGGGGSGGTGSAGTAATGNTGATAVTGGGPGGNAGTSGNPGSTPASGPGGGGGGGSANSGTTRLGGAGFAGQIRITYKYAPSVSAWPTASAITYGAALSASSLSGGSASVAGTFAFTSPSSIPNAAGTYSASVTFTPTDTVNFNTVVSSVNVTVNPKALTVIGLTANNKTADGNTTATFTGTAGLQTAEAPGAGSTSDGKPYTGDTVSVTGTPSGTFATSAAGTAISVSVSGLSLTGGQSANYTLTALTLSANITPAAIDHYVVTFSSPPFFAGAPFTTVVTAKDAFGNTVTSDNTTEVTLTSSTLEMKWEDPGTPGEFDNGLTVGQNHHRVRTLSGGIATFNTRDDVAQLGVTITATDANTKNGTSLAIDIDTETGAHRSAASGIWGDASTWEEWDGAAWNPALTPPVAADGVITILTGHTIAVAADVTVDQVHIQSGAQVNVNSGVTLTIGNLSSPGLEVYGTLNNAGTLSFDTGGHSFVWEGGVLENSGTINSTFLTLEFEPGDTVGGKYRHLFTTTAGTIPTAEWETNSVCEIVGYTSNTSAPGGLNQTFNYFTWNCPSQTGTIPLTGGPTIVLKDLAVTSTGSGRLAVNDVLRVEGLATVSSGAELGGTGILRGSLVLNGKLSPGSSVGRLGTGSQTWNGGATYNWEINDAGGAAGTGWDLLSLTNGIDVQASSGTPFNLKLATLSGGSPGSAANFTYSANTSWTIAIMTNGSATNFAANKFALDNSLFANDLRGGVLALEASGQNLNVTFTANNPPVAADPTYTRKKGAAIKINIAALLAASTSDADGDARSLVSVGTSGDASIFNNGTLLVVTPNSAGVSPITFTYTVRDAASRYRVGDAAQTDTGTITINVEDPAAGSVGGRALSIVVVNTAATIDFAGIPGYHYDVQRAPDPTGPWATIATDITAPANGQFQYVDDPIPVGASYYRLIQN